MTIKRTFALWIFFVLLTAGLLSAGLFSISMDPIPASAQTSFLGNVRGTVIDSSSNPVSGATIQIPALGLNSTSSSSGDFSWQGFSLPEPAYPVTIIVTHSHYGEWRIENLNLVANDTVILNVKMEEDPVEIILQPPVYDRPSLLESLPAGALAALPQADQSEEPLPETILVGVTGSSTCDANASYTVEEIDFNYYVKHVMPNEWGAPWPYESYRAGAMAIKMYAWAYIADGGKWYMKDPPFDVMDSTCDQVYRTIYELDSMNKAVDFTWNWRLLDGDQLFHTFYRAWEYQCPSELDGHCLGQWDSRDLALDGYTWDEILAAFYTNGVLTPVWDPPGGYSLYYRGNGYGDLDRVKIEIDDPDNSDPGPPADIGADDFTLEFWVKIEAGDNTAGSVSCGADTSWRNGNIMFDRDRYNQGRDFGISLADGTLAFGASNDSESLTICGTTNLEDAEWHHIAVQRRLSDGHMWIYVDGVLDEEGDGPDGDISYPDDGTPGSYCGSSDDQPCTNSDPFLVVAAEKHDADYGVLLSFEGWITEIRLSDSLRYSSTFSVPTARFTPDASAAALYHFSEGYGNVISDAAGLSPSGDRNYGGSPNGPAWTTDSPWYVPQTPTPEPTPVFEDVTAEHWAVDYIEALFNAGYISGCSAEPRLYCPD
ncbi:MAG: carboxypeptidase regulatory-like domain-containing protein, partial [Anaerolineales bacterium]|nr:carboxypeptidase regulatory-like domain-containing protein [Anaerolineales bacterium]